MKLPETVVRRTTTSASLDRAVPGRPDNANRAEHDYYRTPRGAVEALLRVETFTGTVWEPACSDGAISEILVERGLEVYAWFVWDREHVGPTQLRWL